MVSSNEDIENILMPLIDDLAPKLKQEIKEELTGPLNVAWHAILLIKSMNMIPLFWSFFRGFEQSCGSCRSLSEGKT